MKVRIKAEYIDVGQEYRNSEGLVIGRKESMYGNDYLIQFETGEVEPYQPHEFVIL